MDKVVMLFVAVFIVSALLLYGFFTVVGIIVDMARGKIL
jgi:hypothetical protein